MKNKKLAICISCIGMILLTIGVTMAFFSYIERGATENTIQSGAITFIYTEIDGQGAGIGITDALPMSDALGEAQTGERNVFNYKIKSENPTDKYINYTVTVRKKSTGTELDNYIKLNVKEVGGSYNKTKSYNDLPLYNNLNNERIIYQGEVTNDPNYEKDFELRMWLSDTLTLNENTNDKSFSIAVNVYAQGADVAQSANCGEAVCENKSFAQYMTEQDQAIVGQYLRINPPTGGSNADSFTGLGFYDDWLKAFARPMEYMEIAATKYGSYKQHPNYKNKSEWLNYKYSNKLVAEYLDSELSNKHINLWFAFVNPYAIHTNYGSGLYVRLYGAYIGSDIKFKVMANQPTRGYVRLSFSDRQGSDIDIGAYHSYPQMWFKNSPTKWHYSAEQITLDNNFNFYLVYDVNKFKEYLQTLDTLTIQGNFAQSYYVLAECNIPDE